ncbi:MAG TPA: diguanylate cyclase [Actinomycetota bacterium]|nr:diguanylate cyclase [Actinomycetota bacterium]
MTDLGTAEHVLIALMGTSLILLSHILGRRGVFRFPTAVTLAFSGVLALVWQAPTLVDIPENLQLPFEVSELLFFAAISIALTLYALEVFVDQARSLARASETLARQAAELARAGAVRQMAAIVQSSNDAIFGRDVDKRVLNWNPAAEALFGYTEEEMVGTTSDMLVPDDLIEESHEINAAALEGRPTQNLETIRRKKDGTLVDVSLTVSAIRDGTGNVIGTSVIARDITEQKRVDELRRLALLDELTGLNNRRGFMLLAEHQATLVKREQKDMALLFIDLNNLKTINDSFGHKEGDRAIADTAAVLRQTFRESDILARVGGDEFCVLLSGDKRLDVDTPLGRLNTNVELHNAQGTRPYRLSLSVGRAMYDPSEPVGIEDLMRQADMLMYQAKHAKQNRPRVLVGDDDVAIRSDAEKLFADNYEIITAQNGEEVIRRATLERPDLILLDFSLPDLIGTDVARRLRQAPSTNPIPIIMMSANGDGSNELEALRSGADDYIKKPIDSDAVRVRMDNLMRRVIRR